MSLALIELHTNYLKLRHDLAAAGYQLVRPATADDQAHAAQLQETVCQECNNLVTYQCWANGESHRCMVVCLECYTAAEI